MPDISMCGNTECTLRLKCYRAQATPDEQWQFYSSFSQDDEGNCDYFWEVECKEVKREGESCSKNNNCNYPNC